MLCGKTLCPISLRFGSLVKIGVLNLDMKLEGLSPPEVFVGRFGFPKVFIGPMVPPVHEDTSLLAIPEHWFGRSIQEVIDMRSKLVRGEYLVNVYSPSKGLDRIAQKIQELGISSSPTESEVEFLRKPISTITLSDHFEPFGPSAPILEFDLGNYKVSKHIEKAFYDTDLKAEGAVMLSYKASVAISAIQRAFSVGAFGLGKHRRFVPTRWSITAVDSIISEKLMQNIKSNPLINEYLVYECDYLDNRYVILMLPESWCYEWIEAWWPGTAWNAESDIYVEGDHEFFDGRTTYASIGGCYYAVRLAVSEKLFSMRRQAGVVALREAYPGYIVPVGVWINRESVRAALRKDPKKFNTLHEALQYISTRLKVPLAKWIETSAVIRNALYQTKLNRFLF
jgi:hypothetical protein